MAYVTGNVTGGATSYATLGLYNNSPGQHVLCIMNFTQAATIEQIVLGWQSASGLLGALGGNGVPAYLGQGAPPGQLTTAANPASFVTPQYFPLSPSWAWLQQPWPFAFLPPGSTWQMQCGTTNVAMFATIWYEYRFIWEFPAIPENPADLRPKPVVLVQPK